MVDITKTDFTIHRGRIDILTGGFPCQPYSMAGKRLGKEDERHLWPEMLRAIREIQPRWVVGENVLGLVNWSGGLVFHEVQADLEAEGYEVQPYVLPACAVNAPHRRDRVWFVAHAVNNRHNARRKEESGQNGLQRVNRQKMGTGKFDGASIPRDVTHPNGNGLNQRNGNDEEQPSEGGLDALNDFNEATMHTNRTSKQGEHIGQTREGQFNGPNSRNGFDKFHNFPTQSPICTRNDGISDRLDSITFSKWRNESIKAGGNAIVPQVVHQIFKAIEQYEKANSN